MLNNIKFRNEKELNIKTQWIFYPYLARGHLTALTSQTGGGKSYLAAWWAIKLSNAGKKVLYVDTYSDDLTLARLYKFQIVGKVNPDYIKFCSDKNTLEDLLIKITDREYDIVIIDAFVFAVDSSEYHLKYINTFKNIAAKTNTSFVLLFNAFGNNHIPIAYDNDNPVELIDNLFMVTLLLVSYEKVKFKNLIITGGKEKIKIKDKYNLSAEFFDDSIKFSFKKNCKRLKAIIFPYCKFVLNV